MVVSYSKAAISPLDFQRAFCYAWNMVRSAVIVTLAVLVLFALFLLGAQPANAASNRRSIPLYTHPSECSRWVVRLGAAICADKPVSARRNRKNNYVPRYTRNTVPVRTFIPKQTLRKRVRPVTVIRKATTHRTRRASARANYRYDGNDRKAYIEKIRAVQKAYSDGRKK